METTPFEGIVGFSETCKALGLEETYEQTNYTSETPGVVSNVAALLERSVRKNEQLLRARAVPRKKRNTVTIFDSSQAPELGVKQYIERIFKYSNCSPSCFVVAYIYIERFVQRCPGFCLTSLSVHRLLITSVMVAAKFLDNTCENNAYYAQVGGVSTEEINKLEVELLFILDFRLHVTTGVFVQYCQYLQQEGGWGGGYQMDHRSSLGQGHSYRAV